MLIYFLRHASAGQKKANDAADEKRPLDEQGIAQCSTIGKLLANADVKIEAIVSSPLIRALQTAELVAKELGFKGTIDVEEALRPEAREKDFTALLKRYSGKESLMFVGHNPNFSEFFSSLISGGKSKNVAELKKGAVAKVEVNGETDTLEWCITPKMAAAVQETTLATRSRPKTSRK